MQFLKESVRINDTEVGIVRDVKLEQSKNAVYSIVVTVVGILTLVKLLHPLNKDELIIVMLGRVTLIKLEQLKNVLPAMVVTLGGIVTVAKLEQFWNKE